MNDSTRLYNTICDSTSDAVYAKDREGRYLLLNAPTSAILGKPIAQVLGRDDTALLLPEDARAVMSSDREVMESGRTTTSERTLTTAAGEVRYYLSTKGPLRDEAGAVVGMFGISRDITDLRRGEEKLDRTIQLLDLTGALAGVGGWEVAVPTMKLTWTAETFRIAEIEPPVEPPLEEGINLFAPEARPTISAAVQAAIESGTPYDLELPIITAKGRRRWVQTQGYGEMRDGKVVRLFGTFQDVTVRRQAEETQKKHTAELSRILEATSGGVWDWNIQTGDAVFSPGYATMLGYDPEDFARNYKTWKDIVHPEDAPRVHQHHLDHFSGLTDFSIEFRMKAKSGDWHWIHSRGLLIERDAGGKPLRMVGTHTDIDARKKAELRLADSITLLETTIEHIPAAIILKEAKDLNIVMVNRATEVLLGRSRADLLGRNSRDLFPAEQAAAFLAQDRELIDAGRDRLDLEETVTSSTNGQRLAQTLKVCIRGTDGSAGFVLGVSQDITERKKTEAALANIQKLESLGVLAGGIAHDFNNILTSLMGNLALLQSQLPAPGEAGECIKEALDACGTAKDLARQLMTFSKGGFPNLKNLDLAPLLTEAASFAARGTNSRCVFDLGERPLAAIFDPNQITRVVTNLIINATQAMPQGGDITLWARRVTLAENAQPSLAAGPYVAVTVADHGAGIASEHLPRIFDPFFSTKQAGRGLGLAMCHSIMAKHRGSIFAESKPGSGAVFTLYLPAGDDAAVPLEPQSPLPAPGSGRVLIMEDEAALAKVLRRILKDLGYTAESVADGQAALDAYADAMRAGKPFDAVIMDLTIPGGMGGKETIPRLLALDPQAKAIVSSGYSEDGVMAEFAKHGFRGSLSKPYMLVDVSEAMRKLLCAEG